MNDINKHKVLLAEDDPTISLIIRDTLNSEGFDVIHVTNGNDGWTSFNKEKPDVIIADVMMPGMDGFEMVRKIRTSDRQTPILFLTARSSLEDLVQGFELGGNDYLKKPFKMLELVIRLKALLNKAILSNGDSNIYSMGDYTFSPSTNLLKYADKSIELSHMESEILKRLCIRINNTVQTNDILNELWDNDSYYNRNSLHGFVHKLRKYLAYDDRVKIINLRGIGYKLIVR